MADDLVISEAFVDGEKAIVERAHVVVHPPKRLRDLHRRRVRTATGNAQAAAAGLTSVVRAAPTATLLRTVGFQSGLLMRLPVYLLITLSAKLGARHSIRSGDFDTWLRDELAPLSGSEP